MEQSTHTLIVTLSLIAFAAALQFFVPGATADTLSTVIVTAVVTRWLQQGAQQAAERQLQQAVTAVQSTTNGTAMTTQP